MVQPVALLIGLRYLTRRPADSFSYVVSWFSATGIFLGTTALILVLAVMNGFEVQLTQKILQVTPQALLTTATGTLAPAQFPLATMQTLAIPGLQGIVTLTTGELVVQSTQGIAMATLLGVDPHSHEPLEDHLLQGQLSTLQPHVWQILLGVELAQRLGVQCGDQVRLMATGARQQTPLGPLPSQRLVTVAGLFAVGSQVADEQVLMNSQDAGKLLRYPPGTVSGWRLFFDRPLRLLGQPPPALPAGLVWRDWQQTQGALFQAVRLEKSMMTVLALLLIAVAAFNIITALGVQVIERVSEVAILQTQGLTTGAILLIFMVQGATRATIGTCLGAVSGCWLATHLNTVIAILGMRGIMGINLPIVLQPLQVVGVMLAALIMALLATLYPAWRAATLSPIEALHDAG